MKCAPFRKYASIPGLAVLAGGLVLSQMCQAAGSPNGGWDAAWSPDGTAIAFTSGSPHSVPNLWVAGAYGKDLRQLTVRGAHEPHWLKDGKTIVFGTVRTGLATYMAVDAGGAPGSEVPVNALPSGAEDPIWSPDGTLVAYGMVPRAGGSRDIWYARTSGGPPTGLTAKLWCREWAWSPDGATITFVVGRATGTSIWTTELSTRKMRILYKGYCSALSYSPDGKRLAFAVPDVRSGFAPVVVDLATRKETHIEVKTFDGARLIWSPDGSRIYFCASRKAEPAIWSVGADGKGLTRLTPEGTPTLDPALSPDGTRFACQVAGKRAYGQEIHVLNGSGKDLANLTSRTSPSFWSPVWSPDGKQLALQSDVNHAVELFVGSPSGRLGKPCTRINGADLAQLTWLPDAKSVLLSDAGQVLVIDSAGHGAAAKPLPKLTTVVQGLRLHGDEIIVTEWGIRDAILAVHKLDGSSKRALTQWQPAEPITTLTATTDAKPASSGGRASAHGIAVNAAYNGGASIVLASDTGSETGNPHADLGLVGPQEDLGAADRPAVIDLSPAVSPDGKSVAFVRNGQIWLVGMAGGGERQITTLPSESSASRNIGDPCWAPDGASIVFTSISGSTNGTTLELWKCGVQKGSEHIIYTETTQSEFGMYYAQCTNGPVFTPDGARLLFTSIAGDTPRVVTVATDGTDLREVAPAPSAFPALDATGARLAYVDLSGDHERIRVRNMASGATTGPLFRR